MVEFVHRFTRLHWQQTLHILYECKNILQQILFQLDRWTKWKFQEFMQPKVTQLFMLQNQISNWTLKEVIHSLRNLFTIPPVEKGSIIAKNSVRETELQGPHLMYPAIVTRVKITCRFPWAFSMHFSWTPLPILTYFASSFLRSSGKNRCKPSFYLPIWVE
jgi:hypothetical protein